ncbi:hypothetical protein [Pradoshia sp.]
MNLKKEQNEFVFYLIEISSIKQFLLLDLLTGTVLYYLFKLYFSSRLIGMIASFVGVEGIRKIGVVIKNMSSR